jgi:cytochrome c nitrite reductase small subunit
MNKAGDEKREPLNNRAAKRRGLIAVVVLGLFVAGLSAFTFFYAHGASYLSDNPRACANCHVMRGHLDDWIRAPHRAVATCNDCHVPHDFLGHWAIKAVDGFKHSFAFTTGFFEEPIRITSFDRGIALANCRRCHAVLTGAMAADPRGEKADCTRCHRGVGH